MTRRVGRANAHTAKQAGMPRIGPLAALHIWLQRHAQVSLESLGRIFSKPVSSLLTISVLGIALALPAGLYLFLVNAQSISEGLDGEARISLFIKENIEETKAHSLAETLNQRNDIAQATLITREQALAEFQQYSGYAEALEALGDNPLPHVIVIRPDASAMQPDAIETLLRSLRADPQVELAQLDLQWVQRLHGMILIARRGALVISALLGLAVLLTVGNTIRLEVQNRREEIIIAKLVGATDGFIRRPFLYSGLWYGLLGSVVSLLLLWLAIGLLAGPVSDLSRLYQSEFTLLRLSLHDTAILLATGAFLGWTGAWVAVAQQLRGMEPR
ncbi:MAG: permease-like cell division protein FtsX [Chromatiales bacterium]|nr:permease-like cell division protein FtsX [Chromatiales bacterium]